MVVVIGTSLVSEGVIKSVSLIDVGVTEPDVITSDGSSIVRCLIFSCGV